MLEAASIVRIVHLSMRRNKYLTCQTTRKFHSPRRENLKYERLFMSYSHSLREKARNGSWQRIRQWTPLRNNICRAQKRVKSLFLYSWRQRLPITKGIHSELIWLGERFCQCYRAGILPKWTPTEIVCCGTVSVGPPDITKWSIVAFFSPSNKTMK
jgi:hypothetical protein